MLWSAPGGGGFLEFFAARIANRRTPAAYGRAVGQFLAWCEARGLALAAVSPLHVAAYIRTHPGSPPTVTQHLAAIRMLGDWLVVSQVLPVNPAAAVRGPKHVVTKGAMPVLSPAEARRLLEAIDTATLAGLRDRALLSVMLYSFARVTAGGELDGQPDAAAVRGPAALEAGRGAGVREATVDLVDAEADDRVGRFRRRRGMQTSVGGCAFYSLPLSGFVHGAMPIVQVERVKIHSNGRENRHRNKPV